MIDRPNSPELVDVVIVGAGLSGIGAAVHLRRKLPGKRFAIIEAREAIGGTWDLFRYPGVRSDSDMSTLGYSFKPWTDARAIADGPAIRDYIEEAAREHGIVPSIRFGQRLVAARWSSEEGRWTLEIDRGGQRIELGCSFLMLCSGYYRYDRGHRPTWPGEEQFAGSIVHPQFGPADLDVSGKRVIVIGSGATAVTLVPALATTAAHVTMLQRSPSYIVSRPSVDRIAARAQRWLPKAFAHRFVRAKNIIAGQLFFRLARARPQWIARKLIGLVKRELADRFVPADFTPRYRPWDQRLCLVPDGDLFAALRAGTASVTTGEVNRFGDHCIILADGRRMDADVVVTATGLELQIGGGARFFVDGAAIDPARCLSYKGVMLSGVPNLGLTFGYTNASWTLKADLTSQWICRLIATMDRRGATIATPRVVGDAGDAPLLDFSSGYVARAASTLPRQGTRHPWRLRQNYLRDLLMLRLGPVADRELLLR
jgi:monooxygenase